MQKTHNNKKLVEYSMRDGFSSCVWSASYLNKYYSAALHERKSLGSLSSALRYKLKTWVWRVQTT